MSEKQIVGTNFVGDLAILLKNYLEPLEIDFSILGEKLFLTETFMECGGLPLFLFDKKEFLKEQVEILNKNNSRKIPFMINLNAIENKDTYLGFEIEIEHNLIYEKMDEINNQEYLSILFKLAEKILSDKVFMLINNQIQLDTLYHVMLKEFEAKNLIMVSNKTI